MEIFGNINIDNGTIALGNASSLNTTRSVNVVHNFTQATGPSTAYYASITSDPITGGGTTNVTGINATAANLITTTKAMGYIRGAVFEASSRGSGTVNYVYGISLTARNVDSTSVVNTELALLTGANFQNAGTIASCYGLKVPAMSNTGTITNLYGVHIGDQSGQATNAWNLYSAGSNSKNYFVGRVGVEMDARPDASISAAGEIKAKSLVLCSNYGQGAPADYGIYAGPGWGAMGTFIDGYMSLGGLNAWNGYGKPKGANDKIAIDLGNYFSGIAGALGTSIRMYAQISGGASTYYGIYMFGPTFDSTVDNNYGIFIEDQGVTNASNPFNIYSDGTASINIFMGSVGIGTETPGSKLSVVGLPTSSVGLSSGDVWVDTGAGNVLKIVT